MNIFIFYYKKTHDKFYCVDYYNYERNWALTVFMIKGESDLRIEDSKASLQRILDDAFIKEIGDAGLLDGSVLNSLGMGAMVARSEIPNSHRRIADSFMLKKKIYGIPVVKGNLSREENALLRKYDFNKLEFTTIRQINEELAFLQSAAISLNRTLRTDSDKILEIRAKELALLIAKRFSTITNEMFSGYLALEKYFEYISTYSKPTNSP